ncbi:MAG: D-alanine--D-alanine ligase [Phycisphaerales bacterium]|jgi:D-alanine-D-alanine ligase|nr:D-alanine--D-alanine ligase [Phycisphaeraceae bacterium]
MPSELASRFDAQDRTIGPLPASVLVLGGGPDSERPVSIKSSNGIAEALRSTGKLAVHLEIIDRLSLDQLRALPGEAIFPYLHGPYGEGGPLQDLLVQDGRPFVGSGPRAARLAMDKVATKFAASRLGIPTPDGFVLNPADPTCPAGLPAIIKPIHEGSTIGLHVCDTAQQYAAAIAAIAAIRAERASNPDRSYIVERKVPGRELTVGVIDGHALPIIEIGPAQGLYDFEAKYNRDDTRYILDPDLPAGIAERIKSQSVALARELGCRHIARVDFMLEHAAGGPVAWLLEINTTPGFTDHSLVPKAARHAGVSTPSLCEGLVRMAMRDRA